MHGGLPALRQSDYLPAELLLHGVVPDKQTFGPFLQTRNIKRAPTDFHSKNGIYTTGFGW